MTVPAQALDVPDRARAIIEAYALERRVSFDEAAEAAFQRGLRTMSEGKAKIKTAGKDLSSYRNMIVELGTHGLEIDRLERDAAKIREDLPGFIRRAFRLSFENEDVKPSDEVIETYVQHLCLDGGDLFTSLVQKRYMPDRIAAALSDYWDGRGEVMDRSMRLEDPDPLVMQEVRRLVVDAKRSGKDIRKGVGFFRLAWLLAARDTDDDALVESTLMGFCISWGVIPALGSFLPAVARTLMALLLEDPNFLKFISEGARWYACAMPVVRVEARMAAALVFTDLPSDFVDSSVRLPWTSFKIVPLEDCIGGDNPVREIGLHCWKRGPNPPRLRMTVYFKNRETYLTREVPSLSHLATLMETEGDGNEDGEPAIAGVTKADARTMSLCGKLAIGTCLRMSDPGALRKRSPKAVKASGYLGPSRGVASPTASEFVLTGQVKVDLRKELSDYTSGRPGFRYKKVQWLVRGHWRNQAFGPGRSDRKVIWIEPFFKGSESAPIAVKTHLLGDPGPKV